MPKKERREKPPSIDDFERLRALAVKKADLEEEVRQLKAALLIYAEIERRSSDTSKSVVSLLPCA